MSLCFPAFRRPGFPRGGRPPALDAIRKASGYDVRIAHRAMSELAAERGTRLLDLGEVLERIAEIRREAPAAEGGPRRDKDA